MSEPSQKRRGSDLNQNNYEEVMEGGGGEEPGTFQRADEATMATRKIRRAKRPAARPAADADTGGGGGGGGGSNPFANFTFGAAASPAPAAGGVFTFGATPAPAPAPAPAATATLPPSSAAGFTFGAPAVPPSTAGAGGGELPTPPPSFGAAVGTTAQPPAATFTFGVSGSAAAPPAAPPAAAAADAGVFKFGAGTAAAAFGSKPSPLPPLPSFGAGAPAATAPQKPETVATSVAAPGGVFAPAVIGAAYGSGAAVAAEDGGAEAAQLNREFIAWMEEEMKTGGDALDWSEAVRDYMKQRAALGSAAAPTAAPPQAPAAAKAPPLLFTAPQPPAAVTPLGSLGGFPTPAQQPPPAFNFGAPPPLTPAPAPTPTPTPVPTTTPAPTTPAAGAADAGSSVGGDADKPAEVWKGELKLSVYRREKRNDEGEVSSEAGWKPLGRGQLRLLNADGVHFVEFRPVVSEAAVASNDAEDEITNARTRYGRAVVSARLLPSTDFTVARKSVQTKLHSVSASGAQDYAMYNIPFGSPEKAAEFAELAKRCVPTKS